MLSFVKIGLVTLEKNISRFRQYTFATSILSSLGKRRGHLIEQTEIQGCFVPNWLTLDQLPLEKKKFKTVNVYFLFISNLTLERHVPLHFLQN